jgi:hypothetical protein
MATMRPIMWRELARCGIGIGPTRPAMAMATSTTTMMIAAIRAMRPGTARGCAPCHRTRISRPRSVAATRPNHTRVRTMAWTRIMTAIMAMAMAMALRALVARVPSTGPRTI